jgi:hypothetical protein
MAVYACCSLVLVRDGWCSLRVSHGLVDVVLSGLSHDFSANLQCEYEKNYAAGNRLRRSHMPCLPGMNGTATSLLSQSATPE